MKMMPLAYLKLLFPFQIQVLSNMQEKKKLFMQERTFFVSGYSAAIYIVILKFAEQSAELYYSHNNDVMLHVTGL